MSDCPCKALPATGDPNGHITASAGTAGLGQVRPYASSSSAETSAPKPKRKKILRGAHCVVSVKTGRPFNCTNDPEKAERLAARLGPRFKVQAKR